MLQKARQPCMVVTKTCWEDGASLTNTASLCQKLGGLRSRLFSMTNLHWKTTPKLQLERKELETRKVGYIGWKNKVFKDHWINVLILLKQNEKWKDSMMNMWKRLQKEMHLIHPKQRARQRRNQQFEGHEEYDYEVEQDGGLILWSQRETCGIQHLRLHQLSGNSTTIGSRTKVGILGDPHPGLNSRVFF